MFEVRSVDLVCVCGYGNEMSFDFVFMLVDDKKFLP